MNVDATPPDDPELDREQAAAKADKIDTIRDQVSFLTDQLMRSFGAKVSLGASGTPSTSTSNPLGSLPMLGGLFQQQQTGPTLLQRLLGGSK